MPDLPPKAAFIKVAQREASKLSPRWVLFEFGSFLSIRNDNTESIGLYAREVLEKHGHMRRSGGDKILYEVQAIEGGWLVSSVQVGLYTIVLEEEVQNLPKDLKSIGEFGLGKRHSDSVDPHIIFIESNAL
jgi:hypothetical protein